MKISVFFKLIACYIYIFLAPYIIIRTIGAYSLRAEIVKDFKSNLYNQANYIARDLTANYYDNLITFDKLKSQLKMAGEFFESSILIVDKDGAVILSTRNGIDENGTVNVNDWDSDLLVNTFSENVMIPDSTNNPFVFVLLPISNRMEINGYLLMYSPMSFMEERYQSYLASYLYFFIPLSIISLIVFLLIYLFLVHPLKKVVKAAKRYASGDYDYELNIRTGDEFQTLSMTLSYMAGELNSLEDYRKNFIANISHDFRSPLTSIKGYVEAMLDGTIPNTGRDKYLKTILFETERLTKLTENLLELNGFEHKRIWLDVTTFDINATIKTTAESFEGVCLKRKIRLQLDFSEDILLVDADMGKIQQVLYNLLDNAIKFSHNNSKIRISTATKGEKAIVSIKDYGIGIPSESMAHIWERFYKIDSSRGKDKKGTGLGLSITKEIIHAHGENINAVSTKGVGSEFLFCLPLH